MIEHINAHRSAHVVCASRTRSNTAFAWQERDRAAGNLRRRHVVSRCAARRFPAIAGRHHDRRNARRRNHAAGADAGGNRHLILGTLHTQDTTHAINRIVDIFPPGTSSRSIPSCPWCWPASSRDAAADGRPDAARAGLRGDARQQRHRQPDPRAAAPADLFRHPNRQSRRHGDDERFAAPAGGRRLDRRGDGHGTFAAAARTGAPAGRGPARRMGFSEGDADFHSDTWKNRGGAE